MTYKAPKEIAEHWAVEMCESGYANGADQKHDVFLKEHWRFTHGSPFASDWTRTDFFDSVRDFRKAEICKISDILEGEV